MLAVALEGLENVLACGEKNYKNQQDENQFALTFEEMGFLDDLENL